MNEIVSRLHAPPPRPRIKDALSEPRSCFLVGRSPPTRAPPYPRTLNHPLPIVHVPEIVTTAMPFFDIPKPFVKALVAGPKKRAGKVADAVARGLVQRAGWAKLARVRSKAGGTRNVDCGHGEEGDVVSGQSQDVSSPVVRKVSSSVCLRLC